MFTVIGTINSIGYRLGVQDDASVVDEPQDGVCMGSENAMAWLRLHAGEEFQPTPTSDPATLDLSDGASVLAFLQSTTAVNAIEGQAPDVTDPAPAGAVF